MKPVPKKKSSNKTLPQTILSPRKIASTGQPVQSSSQSKIQNLKKLVIIPGSDSSSNQVNTLSTPQALGTSARLLLKATSRNKSKSRSSNKNKSSHHNLKGNSRKNKLMAAVHDNKLNKKASSNRLTKQFCEELINWGIKSSSSCIVSQDKLSIPEFVQSLQSEQFHQYNSNRIKMKVLDFVVKRRIVRDAEFQQLYQELLVKFDKSEELIKEILVEILAALDQ